MTAQEIIHRLEQIGYTLTVVDGKVRGDRQDMFPPPPESQALLDALRQHKSEVLDILMYRTFKEAPPSTGDSQTVTFEGEADMKRWALAIQAGLIHLTDKVRIDRRSGRRRITFQCAMPLEWLQDAITTRCKREFDRVLKRVHKGEEWLRAYDDSHPGYERAYAGYLALYEELRALYLAVGETLSDPLTGYEGVPA